MFFSLLTELLSRRVCRTKYARTLTALFRARLLQTANETNASKQAILLGWIGTSEDGGDDTDSVLDTQVRALFQATAVEHKDSPSFDDLYSLQVVPTSTLQQAEEVGIYSRDCLGCVCYLLCQ